MNLKAVPEYIKKMDRRKLIVSVVQLCVLFALVIGVYYVVKFCRETVPHPNKIDFEYTNPDGTLNEKELFRDYLEKDRRRKEAGYRDDF